VRQAGGQTEFVLRVKQAANPNFSFLEPKDQQHPYFRWLVSTKPEVMLLVLLRSLSHGKQKQVQQTPKKAPWHSGWLQNSCNAGHANH